MRWDQLTRRTSYGEAPIVDRLVDPLWWGYPLAGHHGSDPPSFALVRFICYGHAVE